MICSISNCSSDVHGRGLCKRHWQRSYRGGNVTYSIKDMNDIEIVGDLAHIVLRYADQTVSGKAIIDAKFVAKVSRFKWGLARFGYARTHLNGKSVSLHRFVTGWSLDDCKHIDHINGDPLDNRLANLRKADVTMNAANKRMQSNNKSGYRGVSYSASRGRWEAKLQFRGKTIHLGRHKTAEKAAMAYNEAAAKFFGAFASLNVL